MIDWPFSSSCWWVLATTYYMSYALNLIKSSNVSLLPTILLWSSSCLFSPSIGAFSREEKILACTMCPKYDILSWSFVPPRRTSGWFVWCYINNNFIYLFICCRIVGQKQITTFILYLYEYSPWHSYNIACLIAYEEKKQECLLFLLEALHGVGFFCFFLKW